nr:hypothetical protein [Actinomycetota bacterium]NIS30912.1 hypothetical protein [Actinomycetota bacterium]NIT95369.1 hypothetical protein [Actinomycetota bacterium]NIU19050.1 hypothetical protein [Actinomycetota bacterium]NIU66092.1 hypothetical protein [Actinomycetota bacterium]
MESEAASAPRLRRLVWTPVGLLLVGLALIWAIEVLDTVVLGDRLQRNGIHP